MAETIYHGRRAWGQHPSKGQHIGWNTTFEPCPVFKRTAKRIGILSPSLGILYLNREAFDRDGKVYHSKPHEYFYRTKPTVDPERPRRPAMSQRLQSAYNLLGLVFGASLTDIKRQYKRLAKAMHPDGGGDHENFILLNQAYKTIIREVSAHG